MWQVYLHDTLHLSKNFSLIGEVDVNRLTKDSLSYTMLNFPPLPPSTSTSQSRDASYRALPALTLAWQPTLNDGIRVRASAVDGSLTDYQLLKPSDVLLFPSSDFPAFNLGAHGKSYEAEYDHTFPDASFFRLGFIRQQLAGNVYDALEDADGEDLTKANYQAVEAGYERVINPDLTAFANLFYIRSARWRMLTIL